MRASWLVVLASCGGFIDHQAATSTLKILKSSNEVAAREADVQLAREALPGGIFQLAAFAKAYPDEPQFAAMHAEAVCQYAAAFVFDDWEEASMTGKDPAPIIARLEVLLGECLAGQDLKSVGGMRWQATADAQLIATDPIHHLGKLPGAITLLEQTIKVAPGAHDADSELLLGTLRAATSQIFGGDDGSSQFEAARKVLGEGGLIVDVMFARSVAVAHKDRALFEARLNKVLAADPTRWPERRLANELARRKARRYLAAEAQLLPPSVP